MTNRLKETFLQFRLTKNFPVEFSVFWVKRTLFCKLPFRRLGRTKAKAVASCWLIFNKEQLKLLAGQQL